jgi:hypothetical protein
MHYDYVVTLKRENARRTDAISLLLLVVTILAFCFVQYRQGMSGFMSLAVLILFTGVTINMIAFYKGREMKFRNWLFAAGLFWLAMPYFQWMFLPFILFAVLEAQAKYPLEIGFYSGGIVLNYLFKKKYPWNALESVILKDGLLTLDFRNNILFQKEVLDDDEPDADEDEFNDYCRTKLIHL